MGRTKCAGWMGVFAVLGLPGCGLQTGPEPAIDSRVVDAPVAVGPEARGAEQVAAVAPVEAPRIPPETRGLDAQIAENAGVLESISGEGRVGIPVAGGIGTVGTGEGGGGGVAVGVGGLGTRGIGLGSGGAGVGRSGYGVGGGSFGAKGEGGLLLMGAGSSAAPLSKDWKHPGFNPTEIAENDWHSTFSIDVDTASYTQARRQIQGGVTPPSASVRTEEFVNYLRYDYPNPEAGRAFSVTMDGAEHPWLAGHSLMRVGIQGARDERARLPVHLTFLVDTSCSMRSADRLPLAKRALAHLVDNLEEGDTVALATYAGSTEIVLQPTDASRGERIHKALDGLANGGGTAMGSGMELAYQMALRARVPGEENRVIVLSDGDANIGHTSPEQMLDGIRAYADQGITLSTVGFGTGNYRDALMEQLADQGDGNYSYIDSFEEAQRVFGEDLGATLRTIARDVKIQVEFDRDNVLAYTLIGYENREIADEDFRNDAVDAGEIGAGHSVTALYDVVLRDDVQGAVATVRVRHKVPGPDRPATELAVELPSRGLLGSFDAASRDMRRAFGSAAFAEKLRGNKALEEVSYAQIAALIRAAKRPEDTRDAELLGLVEVMAGAPAVLRDGPLVLGQLEAGLVERVVRRHRNQLEYCYQRELAKQPTLQGQVVMKFTVAGSGDVAMAKVVSSTLGSEAVEACLAGRFIRMTFPEPADGVVLVTYPLNFSPT